MPSKSKAKGNANESWIASYFNEWWRKHNEEGTFNRMPSSGGLRWKNKVFTFGDILPPERFPCLIECKHYSEVQIDALMTYKKDSFIGLWWATQACADSQRAWEVAELLLHPMLIWKMNRRPYHMVLSDPFFREVFSGNGLREGFPQLTVRLPGWRPFVILLLDDFFKYATPERLRDAALAIPPLETLANPL